MIDGRHESRIGYAVVDRAGRVLWFGTDASRAWRMVCDLPSARYMVDAADHARILAYRGKRREAPEAS